MRYVISYDVRSTDDYRPLHQALEDIGAQHLLLSQRIIRAHGVNAGAILADVWVRAALQPVDALMVNCLDCMDWAWRGNMLNPDTI